MYSGFQINTPILLINGYKKMSQDIIPGDILLGDDYQERIVNKIYKGEDELYEIKQNNGSTYVVSNKHIIVLITKDEESQTQLDIEISIEKYVQVSDALKYLLLGYKVNPRGEIITSHLNVTRLGIGTYYGWSLNSNSFNNKFLMDGFTVLHDTKE